MPASILVTGATGPFGRAVVDQLLARTSADHVAVLVRDGAKAAGLADQGVDVRVGDYDDRTSLDRAVDGVDTVLLVSSNTMDGDRRVQQHRNVVDAATAAGVRRLGYTSRNLRDPGALVNDAMKDHFETEDDIRASGLVYAIFRNALYMDTIPVFTGGPHVFDAGIHLPAGDGGVAYALRQELGEGVANALLDGETGSRVYTLTGPQAWSFGDVAEALSGLSGKSVTYTDIDAEAFRSAMTQRGMPAERVEMSRGFMLDIRDGQESTVTPELGALLGREPASLRDGLRVLYDL